MTETIIQQGLRRTIKGVADIVFLVDATASMGECIEDLKKNIERNFVDLLAGGGANSPKIDWRATVIPYRDVEADGANWINTSNVFVSETEQLKNQIAGITAEGGGDNPETPLDALYVVVKNSDWRPKGESHRFIVLLSDADAKNTMHESILETGEDNSISRLIHLLSMEKIKLYGAVPVHSVYEELAKLPKSRLTLTGAPHSGEAYEALRGTQFADLLTILAKTVSMSASQPLKAE